MLSLQLCYFFCLFEYTVHLCHWRMQRGQGTCPPNVRRNFLSCKKQISGQICRLLSRVVIMHKGVQLQGASLSWPRHQGLCPWTPLGLCLQTPVICGSKLWPWIRQWSMCPSPNKHLWRWSCVIGLISLLIFFLDYNGGWRSWSEFSDITWRFVSPTTSDTRYAWLSICHLVLLDSSMFRIFERAAS